MHLSVDHLTKCWNLTHLADRLVSTDVDYYCKLCIIYAH